MFKKTLDKSDSLNYEIKNNGDIYIALLNSLRRTILSDISVYAIDISTTKIYKNTSMINNDILKNRLKLIHLIYDKVSLFDHDNLEISYHYKNSKSAMHNIYAKDFTLTNKTNGETLKITDILAHPNTLFGKLKVGQELHFTVYLSKGNTKQFGAGVSPVSKIHYNFKQSDKIIADEIKKIDDEIKTLVKNLEENFSDLSISKHISSDEEGEELLKKLKEDIITEGESLKRNFHLLAAGRHYEKLENGQPSVYEIKSESVGVFPKEELFVRGVSTLIERIEKFVYSINNDLVDKVVFKQVESNMDMFEAIVQYENETLGNLIKTYLYYDPDVYYAGYDIPHPLDHAMVLKVSLKKGNTVDNIKNKIIKTCESVIKILVNLDKEYCKAIGKSASIKKVEKLPVKEAEITPNYNSDEDEEIELSDDEEETNDTESEGEMNEVLGVDDGDESEIELSDIETDNNEIDVEEEDKEIDVDEAGASEQTDQGDEEEVYLSDIDEEGDDVA